MKYSCIVVKDNPISEHGYNNLQLSMNNVNIPWELHRHEAISHDKVHDVMSIRGLEWKWPWSVNVNEDGFLKMVYPTRTPEARISCALSHYDLWNNCIIDDVPYVILEHDACFINYFNESYVRGYGEIIGLNNPIGATRKPRIFNSIIQNNMAEIQEIPKIDIDTIPQGLAGNSAYYITPTGAKALVKKVKEVGLWPNDALMNRQYFGDIMRVTRTYYTQVQGLASTTS